MKKEQNNNTIMSAKRFVKRVVKKGYSSEDFLKIEFITAIALKDEETVSMIEEKPFLKEISRKEAKELR